MRQRFALRMMVLAATVFAVFGAAPAFGQTAQQTPAQRAAQSCAPGPVTLSGALQGAPWAASLKQGDYTIHDFHFRSGETLPELKLHYYTLGAPERDANGRVNNAVLIMHGTGGTGRQFLSPSFGGVLFGPGELLDDAHHFIILTDDIGHGCSSKPSDGLHAHFPHYDYDDMVAGEHAVVADALKVDHLLLVTGTSMGCMHSWVWGETYPDFMDALMPLACQPVEIAGRNRMFRKMVMDAITTDPDYKNGEYTTKLHGLVEAEDIITIMTSSPLQFQKNYPTREQADAFLDQRRRSSIASADPNDMLYQYDSSRNYNPDPGLEKIKAKVLFINSADDQVNPPELGIAEREIKRVRDGRFVLLPITDQTRGHGTHSMPAIWGSYLGELLHSLGH